MNSTEVELTNLLMKADTARKYAWYSAQFVETDSLFPNVQEDGLSIYIAIPTIFKKAPDEVLSELFEWGIRKKNRAKGDRYGPHTVEFMKSMAFINRVRRMILEDTTYSIDSLDSAESPLIKSSFRRVKKLLPEFSEILDNTIVAFRKRIVDLNKFPIVKYSVEGNLVVLDSCLDNPGISSILRDYIIYRELCCMCAYNRYTCRIDRSLLNTLINRFDKWEYMELICIRTGWKFSVKVLSKYPYYDDADGMEVED